MGGKNRMSGGSNMEESWHEMKVTASGEDAWASFYWEDI